MKNQRLLYLYFTIPLLIILFSIAMDSVADDGAIPAFSASVLYVFRMFVVLLTLVSMVSPFTIFKERLLLQIILLSASVLSIILDYYMNISMPGSDNLLWFLPMIIVIYITRYRSLSNSVNKTTDK